MMTADPPPPAKTLAAPGTRVLVADDIEANREVLVRRLKRLGITDIVQAADGREALEAIRATRLDLVLLDIMMPVMTGFDVLEALAAEPVEGDLPVIVISAMNEMEAIVRAISLGAEDFLLKPFDPMLLRARVLKTLEKKRLHDQVQAELRRKQVELAEARSLQLALVPPSYRDSRCRLEVVLEPAREVGGDLVDHAVLADGRHWIVLGDVSDKGAGAALMMARTHALVRAMGGRPDAPVVLDQLAAAAAELNCMLALGNGGCMFVTMLFALFDPSSGSLRYVRCGHVPPFVRRADGRIERLGAPGGLPLGIDEDAAFAVGTDRLEAGDRLLVLSDGVTEAIAPDDSEFGDEGVIGWLASDPPALSSLVDAVRAHEAGGPPSDDLAALLLSIEPA